VLVSGVPFIDLVTSQKMLKSQKKKKKAKGVALEDGEGVNE
jgi:hypothetical protein